jgi:MarR family transcriptional regulator for hemolysin
MLQYEFEDSVGYWLASAHHSYMRVLNEHLEPHGITYRQAQLLGYLVKDGAMSQSELASRMMIEPPSLVGILDRAEEAGLIERRSCNNDRRRKLIHTRPAAQQVWAKIVACSRAIRRQALQGLNPQEIDSLRHLLMKVRENVSSDAPVAS